MTGRKQIRFEDRRGRRWEISFFRGLDDWRLGVYVERHPLETTVALHVPCASVNVQVNP